MHEPGWSHVQFNLVKIWSCDVNIYGRGSKKIQIIKKNWFNVQNKASQTIIKIIRKIT